MKNYCLMLLGVLLAAPWLVSCSNQVFETESAANLFKAIANNDPHAFNWITVEEVDEYLDGNDKEAIEKIRNFASDIDNNVPPLLEEWRKLGEEAGINWQDIQVDTVYVTSYDYEKMGCTVNEGYILAVSSGKKFKIRFEQAIEFAILTGWRTIVLTQFFPLDSEGNPISSVTLKQDGTFEEFYKSLADCVQEEATGEINKIFLVNDKGEKVFQFPEGYSESPWDEYFAMEFDDEKRKNFVKAVENKEYDADEMNYAMLIEYGMGSRFGLDEDEIFNHAELWYVAPSENTYEGASNILTGKFMKYKKKWYYIGYFDSEYEHL